MQTVLAIEANSQSVKGGQAKKSEEHEERDDSNSFLKTKKCGFINGDKKLML